MFDTDGVIRALGQRGAVLQACQYVWSEHTTPQQEPAWSPQGVYEGTYTLHFTIYKLIHHNICQCSCRLNRIINKYIPVNDHRAVISRSGFPGHCSISASHTHTSISLSSITLLCQSSNSVSQLSDKAWHYRVDLSLLCLCECGHDLSDLVIDMPMAVQINAFALVHCGQQTHTHTPVNISNQRKINYPSGQTRRPSSSLFVCFFFLFFWV